jgi:hypothetical protein
VSLARTRYMCFCPSNPRSQDIAPLILRGIRLQRGHPSSFLASSWPATRREEQFVDRRTTGPPLTKPLEQRQLVSDEDRQIGVHLNPLSCPVDCLARRWGRKLLVGCPVVVGFLPREWSRCTDESYPRKVLSFPTILQFRYILSME